MRRKAQATLWSRFVANLGTGVLITGLGALGAAAFDYFNKERELDVRMVEISLSILRGDTKGTEGEHARRFALTALQRYSDITIENFEAWVVSGTVPFKVTTIGTSSVPMLEGFLERCADENGMALPRSALCASPAIADQIAEPSSLDVLSTNAVFEKNIGLYEPNPVAIELLSQGHRRLTVNAEAGTKSIGVTTNDPVEQEPSKFDLEQ